MASLSETFTDPNGQLAGYDTPYPFSVSALNEILADQHIDLRRFNNAGVFRLRTQTELDTFPQSTLDTMTQFKIEEVQIAPGEAWSLGPTHTGVTGSFQVGEMPTFNSWCGARMACDGNPLSLTLSSSMSAASGGAINISGMDALSFIVPEFHSFNTTTSTIQLTSNALGLFTNAYTNPIAFSHSTGSATEIRIPLSFFVDSGATPSFVFSLGAVTGVKLTLISTGATVVNQNVTVMAMRAVTNSWVYHTYEIDTRTHTFMSHPSLDGQDPTPAAAFVPMIRGQHGGTSDPRPTDATLVMRFYTGLFAVTGPTTPSNQIQLLFRENQSGGDGRYTAAQLSFKQGATSASSFKTSDSVAVSGSSINYAGLPHLISDFYYIFQATLTNRTMTMAIYESNAAGLFGRKVWSGSGTNPNYVREQGRVGWFLSLVDRDVQLNSFNATATAFSTMQTKPFFMYTPVDGAQLTATFASDTNVWRDFQGANVIRDETKRSTAIQRQSTSVSGNSWRTTQPIFSNDFLIDDFTQMYAQFDIFVPIQVTTDNQPTMLLTSYDAAANIVFPKPVLQPNQWTTVSLDFSAAEGNPPSIFYKLWIGRFDGNLIALDIPYTWWVDNVIIGRRNVAWQFSANGTESWRDFRDMVNQPYGGLKLPPQEVGTAVQLQATALTESAWIKDFTLFPRFKELGRPQYY